LPALVAGVLFGPPAALRAAESLAPGWHEIHWPFPRDAWEAGRAFTCRSRECGSGVSLFVRPKIGFCNCATGVSDDDEVDRVTDLDLIDSAFKPLGPGRSLELGSLRGRIRAYEINAGSSAETALAIALARKCDVIVAVMRSPSLNEMHERATLRFLTSPSLQSWIEATLENGR
jgi:hypothetical protein